MTFPSPILRRIYPRLFIRLVAGGYRRIIITIIFPGTMTSVEKNKGHVFAMFENVDVICSQEKRAVLFVSSFLQVQGLNQ